VITKLAIVAPENHYTL